MGVWTPTLTPQHRNPSGFPGLLSQDRFSIRMLCVAQTGMGAPGGLGWTLRQHQQTKSEKQQVSSLRASLLEDHTKDRVATEVQTDV